MIIAMNGALISPEMMVLRVDRLMQPDMKAAG